MKKEKKNEDPWSLSIYSRKINLRQKIIWWYHLKIKPTTNGNVIISSEIMLYLPLFSCLQSEDYTYLVDLLH